MELREENAQADEWPLKGERADSELATLAKALGHPIRVGIIRLLMDRDAALCGDIAAAFPVAQSTVSEHLRILRESGLLQVESDGARSIYRINLTALRHLKVLVAGI